MPPPPSVTHDTCANAPTHEPLPRRPVKQMHAEVKEADRIQTFRHFKKHGGVMIITYDMYHR